MEEQPAVVDKREIPKLVRTLIENQSAWIVGGGAKPDNPKPYDWDVVFTDADEFRRGVSLVTADDTVYVIKPNIFGGWKITAGDAVIDMWQGNPLDVLMHPKCQYIWHPMSGVLIRKDAQQVHLNS